MFGFQDYVIDRRSGRPQPHYSWRGESFITMVAWAMAAMFLIGAIFFVIEWREFNGGPPMVLGSILLGAIAHWRQRLLARKRQKLKKTIEAHEAVLDKAFSRWRIPTNSELMSHCVRTP
jgi:hypothetical protein